MHDSAQALRGKKLLLVGFTLFSMFFGAGNLIFPPFLGAQAGTALWPAFVGFAVSAIGLPDGSIGDALYRAKITLSTGELFAWTFVIILLSAVFEKLFLALLDKAVAAVLGEEGAEK